MLIIRNIIADIKALFKIESRRYKKYGKLLAKAFEEGLNSNDNDIK